MEKTLIYRKKKIIRINLNSFRKSYVAKQINTIMLFFFFRAEIYDLLYVVAMQICAKLPVAASSLY